MYVYVYVYMYMYVCVYCVCECMCVSYYVCIGVYGWLSGCSEYVCVHNVCAGAIVLYMYMYVCMNNIYIYINWLPSH